MAQNDDNGKRKLRARLPRNRQGHSDSMNNLEDTYQNSEISYTMKDGSYVDSDGMWHPQTGGFMDILGRAGEQYMENGGIIPTVAFATGNEELGIQAFNTILKTMGEKAIIRERAEQQRETDSNNARERRATIQVQGNVTRKVIRAKSAAKINENHHKTQDSIEEYFSKAQVDVWKARQLHLFREETKKGKIETIDEEVSPTLSFDSYDLADIIADKTLGSRPLMGQWMFAEEVTILFGPTNVGKTILAMQMGLDLAKGERSKVLISEERNKHLDDAPKERQKVIYYSLEMSLSQIHERFKKINPEEMRGLITFKSKAAGAVLNVENVLQVLTDEVKALNALHVTIIIDNLTPFMKSGIVTGSNAQALTVGLQSLIKQAKDRGISLSFLLIGHTGLEGSSHVRGSSVLGDIVDAGIFVGPAPKGYSDCAAICMTKVRSCAFDSERALMARRLDEPNLHFEYDCELVNARKILEELLTEEDPPEQTTSSLSEEDGNKSTSLLDSEQRGNAAADDKVLDDIRKNNNGLIYPREHMVTWGNPFYKSQCVAERQAIWEIVEEEKCKNPKLRAKDIIEKILNFFNVQLSEMNVSDIKNHAYKEPFENEEVPHLKQQRIIADEIKNLYYVNNQ